MGIAAINDDKRVIGFVEKPDDPPSTLAGTLCYLFRKETLAKLKPYKEAGNDMDKAGSFIEHLYKEGPVFGWVTDKTWFDIGDKVQLEKADNPYFIEGRSAKILIDGEEAGFFGEVKPNILNNIKVGMPIAALEMNLDKILN